MLLFGYNICAIICRQGGKNMKKIVFGVLLVALLSFSLFKNPVRTENHVSDGDIWFEFVIAFSCDKTNIGQ